MSISVILFIVFSFLINNVVIATSDVLGEDFDITINISDDLVLYNEILSIPETFEAITYKSTFLYYDNGKFPEEEMPSLLLVGVDDNYYNEHYEPKMRKYSKRSISYYQPKSGTALAYKYAELKKKEIINIFDIICKKQT